MTADSAKNTSAGVDHDAPICISIGILAHNEAERIGNTLNSLFSQSILRTITTHSTRTRRLEVICVANGCTDETADVVASYFRLIESNSAITTKVLNVAFASKANAWNLFVHEFSDKSADYLMLLDADIEFGTDDVIDKMIDQLEHNRVAIVVTDRPLKKTAKKVNLSISERASLAASNIALQDGGISGQLYCGRADALRKIWMPRRLPVEDGFLAAMIATNGFTNANRPGAIVRVWDVWHFFDTHETLAGFLRHEQRIIVGSVMNAWLFGMLWKVGEHGHVGALIRDRNRDEADWFEKFIAEEVRRRGPWLIPSHFMFKRLHGLRNQSLFTLIMKAPVALASTCLSIVACWKANRTLKQATASTFW